MLTVVQAETVAEAAPESVPQPELHPAASSGENPRVSGVSESIQAQGEPDQAHVRARPGVKRSGEGDSTQDGQTEEDTDHRRTAGQLLIATFSK